MDLWERQRSEQNLTFSQSRSHFLRQVMVRPQAAQVLGGSWVEAGWGLRPGMRYQMTAAELSPV